MENPIGEWTIREAGEEDAAELLAVYTDCEDFLALGSAAAASPEMILADLRTCRSEGGRSYGIYLRGGPIVGVLDFVRGNFRGQADTAYIALLMIRKGYRNRGIGSDVVRWVESEVRKNPEIVRIRGGVMVNNPSAIRFWKACGFEIVSGPERLADQTMVFRIEKSLSDSGSVGGP
jgi:ribosomal protein S18 acetylase RimI-like enzyme